MATVYCARDGTGYNPFARPDISCLHPSSRLTPLAIFLGRGKVIRAIVTTALICAAIPALAGNKCQYGSWNREVLHVAAMQDPRWQYRQLTPKEQEKVVERYWFDSHERIDYPHAWIERSANEGMTEYAVIFTDDDGCIQFRLNVTGWTTR